MLGVVILVILASASITNAHYTSSSEYARQCGSDTYLPWSVNNETAYVLFETWSRVACAVRCSTLATCEGYNICPNSSSFYNCEIIDSIRDDFVCSMTESRVNCSVYIKVSFVTGNYMTVPNNDRPCIWMISKGWSEHSTFLLLQVQFTFDS